MEHEITGPSGRRMARPPRPLEPPTPESPTPELVTTEGAEDVPPVGEPVVSEVVSDMYVVQNQDAGMYQIKSPGHDVFDPESPFLRGKFTKEGYRGRVSCPYIGIYSSLAVGKLLEDNPTASHEEIYRVLHDKEAMAKFVRFTADELETREPFIVFYNRHYAKVPIVDPAQAFLFMNECRKIALWGAQQYEEYLPVLEHMIFFDANYGDNERGATVGGRPVKADDIALYLNAESDDVKIFNYRERIPQIVEAIEDVYKGKRKYFIVFAQASPRGGSAYWQPIIFRRNASGIIETIFTEADNLRIDYVAYSVLSFPQVIDMSTPILFYENYIKPIELKKLHGKKFETWLVEWLLFAEDFPYPVPQEILEETERVTAGMSAIEKITAMTPKREYLEEVERKFLASLGTSAEAIRNDMLDTGLGAFKSGYAGAVARESNLYDAVFFGWWELIGKHAAEAWGVPGKCLACGEIFSHENPPIILPSSTKDILCLTCLERRARSCFFVRSTGDFSSFQGNVSRFLCSQQFSSLVKERFSREISDRKILALGCAELHGSSYKKKLFDKFYPEETLTPVEEGRITETVSLIKDAQRQEKLVVPEESTGAGACDRSFENFLKLEGDGDDFVRGAVQDGVKLPAIIGMVEDLLFRRGSIPERLQVVLDQLERDIDLLRGRMFKFLRFWAIKEKAITPEMGQEWIAINILDRLLWHGIQFSNIVALVQNREEEGEALVDFLRTVEEVVEAEKTRIRESRADGVSESAVRERLFRLRAGKDFSGLSLEEQTMFATSRRLTYIGLSLFDKEDIDELNAIFIDRFLGGRVGAADGPGAAAGDE